MWRLMTGDRQRVRRMLKRGKYDDASLTGWGRLDDLVAMMLGLGVFDVLGEIKTEITKSCYIPRWFINNVLALKTLMGEESLNAIQDGMFKDETILRIAGCTAREISDGFDRYRNKGKNKPCNVDSLRYSIEHTSCEAVESAFRRVSKLIQHGKILRGKVYILDATKVVVYGDYEGAGQKRTIEQVTLKNGKTVKREVVEKGIKVVTLSHLYKGRLIVVAARWIPIEQHEITVSDELIDEVLDNFGKGAIQLLLADRGFLDGERMHKWKRKGIDTIIPLKSNMVMLEDMKSLAQSKGGVVFERDDLQIWGCEELETLDSYKGKVNGILVTKFRKKRVPRDQQWGFVTTLPVNTPARVLKVYDSYDDRSLVENKEYRELKQGWKIKNFWGRNKEAITYQVYFHLMMYSLVGIYKSKAGDKFADRGIRRLRREHLKPGLRVIVYVDRYYAVFEFREFLEILGKPPSGKLDDVRFTFGRPP
jgi:nitrogen regulatory protein PII